MSFPVLTLVVCQLISIVAYGHEPTERLKNLNDNTWLLIDKGGVTSQPEITAYSGGWYDPEDHQFCIFGGGHFNYSGNEVWCFDIATLTWTELYAADIVTTPPYAGGDQGPYENYDNVKYPGVLFNPAEEPIENARPMSRHTYDQLEYMQGFGALLWGGYTWGDAATPWCDECKDTWVFADARWKYLFDGKNHSPNISAGVGASAYSSHDNLLYAKVRQETWSYDPDKNRWSKIRTRGEPPWTIEGTLEYDPLHRNLYFFGGNYNVNHTLWRFDIEKRRWAAIDPRGEGPAGASSNGPGMAYDTKNDALMIYFSGTIWVYHPSDNFWEPLRPDVRPADSDYVFGRFRYDPVNDGFWLHAIEDGQHSTWFYRYRN